MTMAMICSLDSEVTLKALSLHECTLTLTTALICNQLSVDTAVVVFAHCADTLACDPPCRS